MPEKDTNTSQDVKKQDFSGPSNRLRTVLLRFRRPLIVLAHIIAFAISLLLSFLVVQNMNFRWEWLRLYPALLLFFLIIKIPVFGLFNQYRGWWRYVGISDLRGIVQASLISTFLIVLFWFFVGQITSIHSYLPTGLDKPAEGVCVADMCATILILGGLRIVLRLYYEAFRTSETVRLKRFLIVGAGNAGEALLREIVRMPAVQYHVIGFIDDDPVKKDTHIHGIPVLGTVVQLPKVCEDHKIEEIAIAIPSASPRQLRRVIQVCEGTKIRFRTVPSITDIASGKLRVSQIRDVDINDLLGRESVQLDLDLIEAFSKDKTILVTGAGGSIGSEMCRQLCHFNPKLLLLIEQAENPLFYVERELRKQFPSVDIKSLICNITDENRVGKIFKEYRPEVVIHAAAHKHVPLMEINPGEAIKNNVIGTQIVADAADRHGTMNFVMISTDKAVNPTSIMGCSKRIAEMYIQDLSRTSQTHFVTVRFGNVLGSDGSVVPIFKKQIAEGGPVTITHPDMKRYFMTIPEASQLVLQAATMGKGGEIFLLDMGEPVRIQDLARELITLSGYRPGEDIEIVYTGPRAGEKLFEELSIEGEDMQRTRHPKISIWKNIPMDRDLLRAGINELSDIALSQCPDELVDKIKVLVREYTGTESLSV
ncbi:MAG: polysaccharide biosynthesis protein [Sedimentisphaerales bacterium]|nr:polysaccharide biosynthesis protein [Sedimentisphaerales bacterium]